MADDVIIQSQSTAFAREGETNQFKDYNLPSSLYNTLQNAYNYWTPFFNLNLQDQSFLYQLLLQKSNLIPGGATLNAAQALSDTVFPGSGELAQVYQKDPFSQDFEDETAELYERSYEVARATALSGPVNVRGGTARMGFELAELDSLFSINRFREIWQNQLAVAALVLQAVNIANQIADSRRRIKIQAQQQQAATEQGRVVQMLSASELVDKMRGASNRAMSAGGEFLGAPRMDTFESMVGEGFQGAVNTTFGASVWR